MRAKEIMTEWRNPGRPLPAKCVSADAPLLDVLPLLLDAPGRELSVREGDGVVGVIDSTSMLEGLGRLMPGRDDVSTIVVRCAPHDYSASSLARAVEDSDAHLVDMLSRPADGGKLEVMLRVRHDNPEAAVQSLRRYGFEIAEASAPEYATAGISEERLAALAVYLGV